ncbi:MAG: cyclic pyranopterin monophosphate synthase MoaC [Armatimonadetes bacterium]|nr:cyclic pyranopterin monophosphate synthase MoaC [Armatimonadota bacterium]
MPQTTLHPTQMIDVGAKAVTQRLARARGTIRMRPETVELTRNSQLPKGNALETARVAAILAAKNTPQIIPLCHPLLLAGIDCDFEFDVENGRISATATVKCAGQTGVEMEALTAAAAALLTIYDMTKGVDDSLEIENLVLLHKSGGKSGDFRRDTQSP